MPRLAACIVLLVLAGCATPPTAPVPHSGAPEPVRIDREGDLLNGTDLAWHWSAAPGFKAFRVHLFLTELPGTGVAASVSDGVRYHLLGDDGAGHHADEGQDGTLSAGNGDGCALCTDDGFPGTWSLTLSARPSAAHYRVHVEVTY